MDVNNIVIVSLVSPKEKMWGQLSLLESKGVTVRGIDLDAFDDFIRQVIQQEETAVSLNTVFFPCTGWNASLLTSPAGQSPRSPSDSTPRSDLPFKSIWGSMFRTCESGTRYASRRRAGGAHGFAMNCAEILQLLASRLDPHAVEGMARFGIVAKKVYGGWSIPALKKLAREIGRDHALAQELWASEIFEARAAGHADR